MKKKQFTPEEKKAYFSGLRDRWMKSKALADNDKEAQALHREAGVNFSFYSYYFTLLEMRAAGLPGTPYIDCKTFKLWREAGFMVRKGEKSVITGITWVPVVEPDDGKKGETRGLMPKAYHLFHRNQVEEAELV